MNLDTINKKVSKFRKRYGRLPIYLILGKKERNMLNGLEIEVLTTKKLPKNWEHPVVHFHKLLDENIFSIGALVLKVEKVDKNSYFGLK